MDYNKILRINGRHINVIYTKMYETVAKMVVKYYDNDHFHNTLFVINVLTDENSNDIDFRGNCPGASTYIYYQLNNLYLYSEYVAHEHMDQFDEIWDFSNENIKYYPYDVKDKVCFMPLRYIDVPKIEPKDEYKFDIGFIGTLTPFRQDMISKITKYWTDETCRFKYIGGVPYQELYDEVADCKYLMDIPRTSMANTILSGSRIFEAICSGKQVICELQDYTENLFPNLLKGYNRVYDVIDLIKDEPLPNVRESFQAWTESNKIYEEYRKHCMKQNYQQKLFY